MCHKICLQMPHVPDWFKNTTGFSVFSIPVFSKRFGFMVDVNQMVPESQKQIILNFSVDV
jgi:hypothetical protein